MYYSRSVLLLVMMFLFISSVLAFGQKPGLLKTNLRLQLQQQTAELLVDPSFEIALNLGLLCSSSFIFSYITKEKVLSLGTFRNLALTFLCGYVSLKTSSVRMKFTDFDFSLVKADKSSLGQHPLWSSKPSLANKADYVYPIDKISSYSYLPSEDSPLFLYIKESELPPEEVIQPPFIMKGDEDPTIQVHIFPMIGQQQVIEERFSARSIRKIDASKSIAIQPDIHLFVKGLLLI